MLKRKILLIISNREGIKRTFYIAVVLQNPGSANDAVLKRFLYKRIPKLTNEYSLESISGNINSINNEIAELQKVLLSNRKSSQEKSMSLQNEIPKMSEALSLNVSTTENEIMKQLRKKYSRRS